MSMVDLSGVARRPPPATHVPAWSSRPECGRGTGTSRNIPWYKEHGLLGSHPLLPLPCMLQGSQASWGAALWDPGGRNGGQSPANGQ